MPDLDSCIPFPIDETTLNDVVQKAKDWALMHGAAMRSKANFSEDSLQVSVQYHSHLDFIEIPTLNHVFSFIHFQVCAVHFTANAVSTPGIRKGRPLAAHSQ